MGCVAGRDGLNMVFIGKDAKASWMPMYGSRWPTMRRPLPRGTLGVMPTRKYLGEMRLTVKAGPCRTVYFVALRPSDFSYGALRLTHPYAVKPCELPSFRLVLSTTRAPRGILAAQRSSGLLLPCKVTGSGWVHCRHSRISYRCVSGSKREELNHGCIGAIEGERWCGPL